MMPTSRPGGRHFRFRFAKQAVFCILFASLTACASQQLPDVPEGQKLRVVQVTPAVLEAQSISRDIAERNRPKPMPQAVKEHIYRIGVGDVLLVKTSETQMRPEGFLSQTNEQQGITVDEQGDIIYPYVGRVHLGGLTIGEARDTINQRLADYYQHPQMDVAVLQFNSRQVFVSGAVNKPGSQPLTLQPMTVLRALDGAGGLLETADYEQAVVQSADGTVRPLDLYALLQLGDDRFNYLLQPGDTVQVPETTRNYVAVLGEVLQPGRQPMRYGRKSLSEALAEAKGVNEFTADERHIYVIRGAVGRSEGLRRRAPGDAPPSEEAAILSETQVFELNAASPAALALGERFALEPRDVVYVAEEPITEWSRFINQLLPGVFSGAVSYRANQI